MKIVAVTQARIGSTRFPEKILQEVQNVSLLELHLKRILKSKRIDKLKIATTNEEKVSEILDIGKKVGVETYQGDLYNVLDRFYQCLKGENPDYVVRLTSDCPIIDAELIDKVIDFTIENDLDYGSNALEEVYPDGQDVEVFKYSALVKAWEESTLESEKEHVTPFIYNNSSHYGKTLFKSDAYLSEVNYNHVRLTVDTPEDLVVVEKLIEQLGLDAGWQEYTNLYLESKNISSLNDTIIRNEGYLKSLKKDTMTHGKGQELYKKAKTLIPGGTMLLSKRPEMFLPERWPSYYSKAQGCNIWDLDGNKFTDVSIMGIGTNILGYGNEAIDNVVRNVVNTGNMSTLSCPEEVYLAEELMEMNPWADMVRFARTGGEANAIAIRIARAASGKDKVAICGYHGWHDWYLSTNLGNNEGLNEHLLPGLNPAGVPSHLKGSVYPFLYNDYEELENLVKSQDIGVIKMEVQRNEPPKEGYLEKVRKLATDNNIVLIFDECTSGFRETYGPLFKKYNVMPDMTVFGKTIANGYALTAVVGRREVMEAAQDTFISSTFWTERIGPAAALKTLEVMRGEKPWEYITEIGGYVKNKWVKMAEENKLDMISFGLNSLAGFAFTSKNSLKYKTLITQEMLKKNYLASTLLYSSTAHTKEIVDQYLHELNEVFRVIAECEKGSRNIDELLEGPVCHGGFKRLN
ncbi:MAG: aminotransferase class III-fold pyridoxal phosphate-dependent enzyme [Flavobacteriales bacterium]|jgi:glutamate-1-semialdehyde 2,1-aminomutase|nr:aminotransferase class III-fold pyridoxal phosphate-dependent enzyme [Flavobacteriales bacterium]